MNVDATINGDDAIKVSANYQPTASDVIIPVKNIEIDIIMLATFYPVPLLTVVAC